MSGAVKKLLEENKIIVCCGSGGVGKTTTSAALAMAAARLGRKSVVITIDPAKRLATSLGLKKLSGTPSDLTPRLNEALREQGLPEAAGSFFAVMPDSAETFEQFVRSMAGEDQNRAARVLKTSVYKIFTREFAGTNEYMAMEKLFQIFSSNEFDLIVLDTPPAANTRFFLEAPRLLADFFDDRIMKWLIAPGSKLLASGIKKLLEILEHLTGKGFVSELIEFTTAMFELRANFLTNLDEVAAMLHRQDTRFLMVTSPERLSKNDTLAFVDVLKRRGYTFWGFIVNRVLSMKLGILGAEVPTLPEELSDNDKRTLRETFTQLESTLKHEKSAADFLKKIDSNIHVVQVPEQTEDVHSVRALLQLSRDL